MSDTLRNCGEIRFPNESLLLKILISLSYRCHETLVQINQSDRSIIKTFLLIVLN